MTHRVTMIGTAIYGSDLNRTNFKVGHLKYITNNLLRIFIISGAQDYFIFTNRAATLQYFGVPHLFSVLLGLSQSLFLPVRGLALQT